MKSGDNEIFLTLFWEMFLCQNGVPFLGAPNNLPPMMNTNWYRPYKYSEHSVDVIYTVVLNLPRELIPGPKEPKLHVNSFLDPLVDELLQLWEGVQLPDSQTLPFF